MKAYLYVDDTWVGSDQEADTKPEQDVERLTWEKCVEQTQERGSTLGPSGQSRICGRRVRTEEDQVGRASDCSLQCNAEKSLCGRNPPGCPVLSPGAGAARGSGA